MLTIQGKRILSLNAHLPRDLSGKKIYVGVNADGLSKPIIESAGLSFPLVEGESILPPIVGPATRFNAKGRELLLREKPKEDRYRDVEFTRMEFHGDDRREVTDCIWIHYQRYQRQLILPPSVEIVVRNNKGTKFILSGPFLYGDPEQEVLLLAALNVYLEMFGFCNLFDDAEKAISIPKIVKLNWELLPKGKMPWEKLREKISEYSESQRAKSKAAAMNRFEQINNLEPDFVAVGRGGFKGYVVFGFSKKSIYVLESQNVNNAVYVFGNDWKTLSQLSKAEILESSLQEARIIHGPTWFSRLTSLLR
jgi:hypothetical protein